MTRSIGEAGEAVGHALAPGEVHVWLLPLPEAPTSIILAGVSALLSDEERERCKRYRRESDRVLCSVGRAATRSILSRYAGLPPKDWRFRTGEYGRPEVAAPAAIEGLRFNRSHTPGLVAVAVSRPGEVGIDVESLDRGPFDPRVAERCFSSAERQWLERGPRERRERNCLELWTLKEAYVKATGRGLGVAIQEIEFHLDGSPHPLASFGGDLHDDPARWDFRLLAPTPDHVVAVAAERVAAPPLFRVFTRAVEELWAGSGS